MKETISAKLSQQLSHLDESVHQQIIREAKLLKSRSNQVEPNFDVWVERALRRRQKRAASIEETQEGQVTSVFGPEISVKVGDEIVRIKGCITPLVVGDKVTVGIGSDGPVILDVLPRKTWLSRPDNAGKNEKLIVANVDIVVIVVSVVSPPLHPRLIDRYLAAIQNGGAEPLICVNKMDLLPANSALPELDPYRRIGIRVVPCSTSSGLGIDQVRGHLTGKVAAFVGHSGVGKSSTMNALFPSLDLNTGDTMRGYGRGAHTTTASSMHFLPEGLTLIDTPGVRSFGLWEVTQDVLLESFPEIASRTCRFRNCTHQTEPGCGVIEALESGEIPQERYDAYFRLLEEVG